MSFSHRRLSLSSFQTSRQRLSRSRQQRHLQRPRKTLRLELLEDRALLAAISWDGGGGDFDWNNELNWIGNMLPGPSDEVVIDLGANAFTVGYSSGSTSIKSLTSHASLNVSGGTLDFAESSVIAKVLTLNSTISGAGDVTVQGQFYNNSSVSRIAGSGRLILQGNSYFGTSPLFERSVINRGVLIQESNATLAAGVTFTNEAGATIDFHDGRFFGSGKVVNHGLFRKTTGASSRIDGMFTQSASGALDLQQGTFSFNGGGFAEGDFQGAAGTTLVFATFTLNAGASLVADRVTVGSLVANGSYKVLGGTTVDGSLTLQGPTDIVGSDLSVTGTFDATAANLLSPLTFDDLTLVGTFLSEGDVIVQGLFYNNSSVSRIAGSGRLILQGNSYFGTSVAQTKVIDML